MPVTMILIIIDGLTIFLSGLIGLGGVIRAFSDKKITLKKAIIHCILQFVFCVDIISAIIIYKEIKKGIVVYHSPKRM